MVQFGQYPSPAHTIMHLSDPHLLAGGAELFGTVDTDRALLHSLERLERFGTRPEAIVVTGDLADRGEPDAYARLKSLVEPVAERLGAELVWVMGNHDERPEFASILYGEPPTDAPQDRVHDMNGLRVVALDTSVPGYHHGELTDGQLEWLAGVLATPAPHGTIIALHHPPLPTPLELMAIIELRDQWRLAEIVRDTDVRAILGGHLHYSTHGTFAGIPVSVAAATCYTFDVSAGPDTTAGVYGAHAFNLVQVYEDRIVHSVVPADDFSQVNVYSADYLARLARMTAAERTAAFSRKSPPADPR